MFILFDCKMPSFSISGLPWIFFLKKRVLKTSNKVVKSIRWGYRRNDEKQARVEIDQR